MNVEDEEDELGTLVRDPAVREAVFESVTVAEAYGILRSRLGKPWCDAFMVNIADDMDSRLNYPEPFPQAETIGDGARKVFGLSQSFARKEEQP